MDTFPYCVEGQVWHLILSICDLYLLYTSMKQSRNCSNFFFGWREWGWFGMLNIDIYFRNKFEIPNSSADLDACEGLTNS